MTRVLSGAVLLALAIAVVWLSPAAVFFVVAELLLVLGFVEYAALARSQRTAGAGDSGRCRGHADVRGVCAAACRRRSTSC